MPRYSARAVACDVVVGRDEDNRVSIEITPEPWSNAWESVGVRLSIPYGRPKMHAIGTFLLPDDEAYACVEMTPGVSGEALRMDRLDEEACWEAAEIAVDRGDKLTINVTGLTGSVPPGDAQVFVGVRGSNEAVFSERPVTLKIPLPAKHTKEPVIHYFDSTSDYVLHAGQDEVTLSFFTTGTRAVTVFRNNTKVWPPHDGTKNLFFTDKPTITSVYRLEARGEAGQASEDRRDLLDEGVLVVRTLTVQVAQAGWNRLRLPQGYPTVLLAAQEGERLHGVFVGGPETVGLYSSATGFPPWKMESDIQSEGPALSEMSHSPGVADSAGGLWLIGGSSVDSGVCSNAVWSYQKEASRTRRQWRSHPDAPFSPRMGHCVVDFDGKLWVLGGFDGDYALNEVWSYDYSRKIADGCKDDRERWSCRAPVADWSPRCMFAAVATPAVKQVEGFEEEKLWIYGGTDDPDLPGTKADLWSTTTDGQQWEREERFELGPLPGKPNGATLFWDDGRLHLAGSFKAETRGDAEHDDQEKLPQNPAPTLSAMVYSLCPRRRLWEANPVSWGWEQFDGDAFVMRCLVFNRFWFLWSLHRDIRTSPKLNVFIPS